MDGSSAAHPPDRLQRGYGGVSIILNPLIRYQLKNKYSTSTIQSITAKVAAITITVIYIGPRASVTDETVVLDRIHKISTARAIIMGDMNTRHVKWDSRSKARGLRLVQWAERKAWIISGPAVLSYRSPRGGSSPDIFMTKGLNKGETKTRTELAETGSYHLPVKMTTELHHCRGKDAKGGRLHSKLTRNTRILENTRLQYRKNLPNSLEKVISARDCASLEDAYRSFKEVLLSPWDKCRKKKPNWFKP